MRLAVVAQCFGAALTYGLGTGGLATLYAQRLGAQDFMVGLINATLWASLLTALFVPGLVERYNKRAVMVASLAIGNAVFLPVLFLPQIAAATSQRVALAWMVISLLAFTCSSAGFRFAWFPALRDFVPREQTGRFFGRLRMSWKTVTVGVFIVFAVFVGEKAPTIRFQIILAALLAGSVVRMILLTRLPQRPAQHSGRGVVGRLKLMFSDKPFMRFTLFSIAATCAASVVFPTLILYAKRLGMSDRLVIVAMVARMASVAVSHAFWGHMADRCGTGRVYRIGLLWACAGLLLWVPVSFLARGTPHAVAAYALIFVAFAVHSCGQAGVGIAWVRHGFQLTPRERAASYLCFQPAFVQAFMAVGQLLVGAAMGLCHAQEATGRLNPYVVVIALSAVAAAGLAPFARRLPKAEQTQ